VRSPRTSRLHGGRSSPACASYASRKVADEIETLASSETVLIAKRRFDVDHCLNLEKSVDEAAQTSNKLHCFCEPGAIGYGAVCYLCLLRVFAIHCSVVLARPRVSCRLEFCAVTIAFKVSRLVATLVTIGLVLRTAWEIMVRSLKNCALPMQSLLHQRQIRLRPSRNLRVGRHYSDILL